MSSSVHAEPLTVAAYAILDERGDQARNYLEALALFEHAERLGVEGVWVRQFHLAGGRRGGLPSPFVFLAWLAARTTRLRLGTSIVTLPLESPLRVAEDAAVLDALSGGRLELGVGNGGYMPGLAALLGQEAAEDAAARREAYLRWLDALLGALRGNPLDDAGGRLNPPAPGLEARVWQAALSDGSGRAAGERGHGLLVGTTQTVPTVTTARAYFDGLPAGVAPRLGLATLIYPSADRESGLREAAPGIEEKYAWGREFLPPATTLAEKAASIGLHVGTSEQIAESILAEPALPYATQLLVQTELVYDTYARRADALEQFTTEIAQSVGAQTAAPALIPTGGTR